MSPAPKNLLCTAPPPFGKKLVLVAMPPKRTVTVESKLSGAGGKGKNEVSGTRNRYLVVLQNPPINSYLQLFPLDSLV